MFTKSTVIFLMVIGAALAVPIKQWPWPPAQNLCQKACLLNDLSKLRYETGKTYEYELQVESEVQVNTLSKEAKLSWTSLVELHFDTPCEVTVQFKNPLLDGQSYPSFAKEVSEYPLKATFMNGVFETVCADPRDFTTAVNIKKGLLSTLQNSLPSNATMYSGTTIVETDVVGVCPTNYTVQQQGQKIIVEKMKDHRLCTERYSDSNQSPAMATILKSPTTMRRSESKCTQEIENGIIQSVSCRDSNEVTPAMGIKKFAKADQRSTLKLKRVSRSNAVPQLSSIRPTNLIYDFALGPGNSSAIADLERKLREISEIIKHDPRNNQTADMFSDLIEYLNQVPERTVEDVLQKIKNGQYGDNVEHLEGLYLDALTYTINNGAIPVMVDSILHKKRVSEYTLSLFSIPRICEHGVESVKPIFEADDLPTHTILSAGFVVGTYCRTEGSPYNCENVTEVREVLESINAKLSDVSAKSKNSDSKRIQTIALLKAVGNIRRMTESLQSTILSIVQQKGLPEAVRVAAADSLKKLPCKSNVSNQLLALAREHQDSPDVRIFAYKAGIECSSSSDLYQLVNAITRESDLRVRSYILSDLTSLQQSTNPQKLTISQRLAPLNISQDYPKDMWSNSLHSERSFFTKSNFMGSEIDFDVVFDSMKMMPTELRTNLTMELFKEIFNVAEMGVRFENWPQILQKLVAPGTVLGDSNVGQMIRGIVLSMPKSSSGSGKMDYFLKVFGTEMIYSSFDSEKSGQVALLKSMYEYLGDSFFSVMAKSSGWSMRGMQYRRDMTVSTIQGIPLMINMDIDVVSTFSSASSGRPQSSSTVAITPTISAIMKNFVGYKFGPSVGLVRYTKLSMPSDLTLTVKKDQQTFSAKIDLPQTDILPFNIVSEGYLMTQKPGQKEQRSTPLSRDPRATGKKCLTCKFLEVQFCYEYDVTNFLNINDYPLVQPMRLWATMKKTNPSVTGFEISGTKKSNEILEAKIRVLGTPTEMAVEMKRETSSKDSQLIAMEVKSTGETLKGIKIVYSSRTTGNSTERSMNVFTGSQQQVFNSSMLSGDRKGALKIQTLGQWSEHLLVNVDVRGHLREKVNQTASIDYEKMEFLFATKSYRSESFMRKHQTTEKIVHLCESSLMSNGSILYNVSSLTNRQFNQSGFTIENNMTMRAGKQQYNSYILFKELQDYHYYSMVITNGQSEKLVNAVAYCDGSAQTRRFSVISLELPKQDVNWKFTSNLVSKGQNENDYEIHLLSKEKIVAIIKGPLELIWTDTTKKVSTSLGVRGSDQINYHVEGLFEMSPQINTTEIVVRNQTSQVIEYKHSYIWSPTVKSLESKLVVPEKIHSDISMLFEQGEKIKVAADMRVPMISPRHVHGHFNAIQSGSDVHYSSLVRWDADRDPEKKFSVSGILKTEKEHKILQGQCMRGREITYYDISYAKTYNGLADMQNEIIVHLKNRTSEFLTFKSKQHIDFTQSTDLEVENIFYLKTPSGNVYELEHGLAISKKEARLGVLSIVRLNTPSLAHLTFRCEWKSPSQTRSILSGILKRIPQSPAQTPLEVHYHGDFEYDSRSALESARISLDAVAPEKKISLSASDSSKTGETKLNILKNSSPQVELMAKRDGPSDMEVTVKALSLNAEMIGKMTQSEKSIRIIPDISQRQKMIEMKFSSQPTEKGIHRRVRFEYPHNGRQKSIDSVCVGGEATIELDVMAKKYNTTRVIVKTITYGPETKRFIVSLASNTTEPEFMPTMIIDKIQGKHEVSLITSFHRSLQAPATSVVKLQYVKQSPIDGVITVAVSSPESKFEIGGSYRSLVRNGVQGFQVNTTMKIPDREPYMVQVLASKPAFIKVVAGKKFSTDRYVAKLGLKSYIHGEISIMKDTREASTPEWKKMSGYDTERAEHPIFALSTKLIKPETLALRVQNSNASREEFKDAVKSEYQEIHDKMAEFLSKLGERLAEEVETKVPQSKYAMQGLRDFLRTIKESELVSTMLKPIQEFVAPFLTVLDSTFDILQRVSKYIESTFEQFIEKHSSIKNAFNDSVQSIVDRLEEALQIKSSEVDSDIIRLFFKIMKKFLDSLIEKNCSSSADKCQKLEDAINQIADDVQDDFLNALQLFGRYQSVARTRSLLSRYVHMYSRKEYMHMVESAIIALSPQHIGLLTHKSGYQINLPLRQPLGSVLITPWHIGLKRPGFGEHFIVIGQDRLKMINGSHITLPNTKCEYWLYKPANNRTKMTFGNLKKDNHFQTVTFKEHTIVFHINQKTINIDGTKYSNNDNLQMEIADGFKIYQRHHATLILTPDVLVGINWFIKESATYVRVHGEGVPFLRMSNSDSDYNKLMKMSKYQTVKSCVP